MLFTRSVGVTTRLASWKRERNVLFAKLERNKDIQRVFASLGSEKCVTATKQVTSSIHGFSVWCKTKGKCDASEQVQTQNLPVGLWPKSNSEESPREIVGLRCKWIVGLWIGTFRPCQSLSIHCQNVGECRPERDRSASDTAWRLGTWWRDLQHRVVWGSAASWHIGSRAKWHSFQCCDPDDDLIVSSDDEARDLGSDEEIIEDSEWMTSWTQWSRLIWECELDDHSIAQKFDTTLLFSLGLSKGQSWWSVPRLMTTQSFSFCTFYFDGYNSVFDFLTISALSVISYVEGGSPLWPMTGLMTAHFLLVFTIFMGLSWQNSIL